MSLEFSGPAIALLPDDIDQEAGLLRCPAAMVRAVCDVESAGSGFLPDGRPKILFEAKVFHTLTSGHYDASHPGISSPAWDRTLYGASGAHQYDRLGEAISVNRSAALRSTSWGMFQIMGVNFAACGFKDEEAMVRAMMQGEREQLFAFGEFCEANHLDQYLQMAPPAFASFARGYNGPGYAANGYDVKLAAAYRKHLNDDKVLPNSAPRTAPEDFHGVLHLGSHGDDVKEMQKLLVARGFETDTDGDFGPETLADVIKFQRGRNLKPVDGIVGPITMAALEIVDSKGKTK